MNNPITKFFTVGHLPVPLQEVSAKLCELASWLDANVPDTAEKSAGLRKLLEAKDCFVRAQSELLDDAADSESQRFRAGVQKDPHKPTPAVPTRQATTVPPKV